MTYWQSLAVSALCSVHVQGLTHLQLNLGDLSVSEIVLNYWATFLALTMQGKKIFCMGSIFSWLSYSLQPA